MSIDTGTVVSKTALSLHPYYKRWASFNQRCENPKSPHWKSYGERGIVVEEPWATSNPKGFENFRDWVNQQLELNPHLKDVPFEVYRKEVDGNYCEGNCVLVKEGLSAQRRRTAALTLEIVVEARRKKRTDPKLGTVALARTYGVCDALLSRAIRGLIWKCANDLERPWLGPEFEPVTNAILA
jgi:hypothetical protein